MLFVPAGTAKEARDSQFRKASAPIEGTPDAKDTEDKVLQSENALSGIPALLSQVSDDALLHPEKAAVPTLVTDDGTTMLCSELQPAKAYSPILVTEDGIETDVIEVFKNA